VTVGPTARDERETAPPPRPPAVELAGAILVVGGAVNLVGAILAAATGTAEDPFLWLTLVLNAASITLGLAARFGRLWLVTVNFAAVLGFLDIVGASVNPAALMLGLAEVLVVVILIRHKPWFDARRQLPDADGGETNRPWRVPVGSALDAADGEATDEVALEDEEDDRDGQGEENRERGEL
jgi:hypothetical protein